MVDDLPPFELRQIFAAEAVAPRSSIDFEGIFEPVKRIVPPRRLEAKVGNGELREINGNGKIKNERGAAGAIDRLALCDSARLADAQSIVGYVASFSVILVDLILPTCSTNPSCLGLSVVGFFLHLSTFLR